MKHCIVAVLVVSTTATAEALPNRSGRGVKELGKTCRVGWGRYGTRRIGNGLRGHEWERQRAISHWSKNGNAFSMWVRTGGLETYPPLAGRWPPTADHDHDRDHDHDYDQDQDHDHEHNHNIHDDYDDRDT